MGFKNVPENVVYRKRNVIETTANPIVTRNFVILCLNMAIAVYIIAASRIEMKKTVPFIPIPHNDRIVTITPDAMKPMITLRAIMMSRQ